MLWYGNALPALAGLSKVKVEGRLKNLQIQRGAAAGVSTTNSVPTSAALKNELVA